MISKEERAFLRKKFENNTLTYADGIDPVFFIPIIAILDDLDEAEADRDKWKSKYGERDKSLKFIQNTFKFGIDNTDELAEKSRNQRFLIFRASSSCELIEDLTADCDKWKKLAKALLNLLENSDNKVVEFSASSTERAVKKYTYCGVCTIPCKQLSCKCVNGDKWQFDEARFAELAR